MGPPKPLPVLPSCPTWTLQEAPQSKGPPCCVPGAVSAFWLLADPSGPHSGFVSAISLRGRTNPTRPGRSPRVTERVGGRAGLLTAAACLLSSNLSRQGREVSSAKPSGLISAWAWRPVYPCVSREAGVCPSGGGQGLGGRGRTVQCCCSRVLAGRGVRPDSFS